MLNMLDLKDRRILYELDLNSRQSFQKIGRKIRLSKETVFHRIKKLEEQGIIQRYSTMVDVGKLGYINFRIFLKLQNTTTTKEQEIINYLEKQKAVGWFVTVEGNWDLNIWLLCKSIEELNEFWENFNKKYINYIAQMQLSVFTNITYFSKAYLLDIKNTYRFRFVTLPKEEKIDNIDKNILKLMAPNSRISVVDIAQKLGISDRTVTTRIRNLERKKIIVGYKTLIDLSKWGYLYYKTHFKLSNITEEKERIFRQYVFEHPNIVYDNIAIGGPNLEIDIQVENTEKLREILKEIKDKFSSVIQDHEILHYLKEYKYLLLPI